MYRFAIIYNIKHRQIDFQICLINCLNIIFPAYTKYAFCSSYFSRIKIYSSRFGVFSIITRNNAVAVVITAKLLEASARRWEASQGVHASYTHSHDPSHDTSNCTQFVNIFPWLVTNNQNLSIWPRYSQKWFPLLLPIYSFVKIAIIP